MSFCLINLVWLEFLMQKMVFRCLCYVPGIRVTFVLVETLNIACYRHFKIKFSVEAKKFPSFFCFLSQENKQSFKEVKTDIVVIAQWLAQGFPPRSSRLIQRRSGVQIPAREIIWLIFDLKGNLINLNLNTIKVWVYELTGLV